MKNKNWLKPAIKSTGTSCPCCGSTNEILSLETSLYNGFGGWKIFKNGQLYFQDDMNNEFEDFKTLKDIEEMIGDDEENEYVADLFTPLRGATYQRHSKNHWVLIATNNGFA